MSPSPRRAEWRGQKFSSSPQTRINIDIMIKPKQFRALEMGSEQTPNREVFVQDELLDWGSEEGAESGLCPRSHFRPLHSIPCIHQALQTWKGQWLGLCMHCAGKEGREHNGSAPKWACIGLFLLCIDHDNRKIANTNIKEGKNAINDFQSTSKFKSRTNEAKD